MSSYDGYRRLKFDRPHPRVLRITMDHGKMNAADRVMHGELVRVWRDIDADSSVNAAIITGAGGAFSAGGDFAMIGEMIADFETRARIWKEARDLVYNIINCSKPVVSAMRARPWARGWFADCWPIFRSRQRTAASSTATRAWAWRPEITPRSSGRCCAAWPKR